MTDKLENAKHSLDCAKVSLQELKIRLEAVPAHKPLEDFVVHYVNFVGAVRHAFSKGAHKGWSDKLLSEQKRDAKLNYAFQLRNSIHDFQKKREIAEGGFSVFGNLIHFAPSCTIREMSISIKGKPEHDVVFGYEDGVLTVHNGVLPVERHANGPKLGRVTNRGQSYDPPQIDASEEDKAHALCQYVYEWMRGKFAEGKNLG